MAAAGGICPPEWEALLDDLCERFPFAAESHACGGGLNAFLERVWAVGGCSAFSVPSLYVFLSSTVPLIIQVHIHVGHLTSFCARHEPARSSRRGARTA